MWRGCRLGLLELVVDGDEREALFMEGRVEIGLEVRFEGDFKCRFEEDVDVRRDEDEDEDEDEDS